jgi:hypothetical protein
MRLVTLMAVKRLTAFWLKAVKTTSVKISATLATVPVAAGNAGRMAVLFAVRTTPGFGGKCPPSLSSRGIVHTRLATVAGRVLWRRASENGVDLLRADEEAAGVSGGNTALPMGAGEVVAAAAAPNSRDFLG